MRFVKACRYACRGALWSSLISSRNSVRIASSSASSAFFRKRIQSPRRDLLQRQLRLQLHHFVLDPVASSQRSSRLSEAIRTSSCIAAMALEQPASVLALSAINAISAAAIVASASQFIICARAPYAS